MSGGSLGEAVNFTLKGAEPEPCCAPGPTCVGTAKGQTCPAPGDSCTVGTDMRAVRVPYVASSSVTFLHH